LSGCDALELGNNALEETPVSTFISTLKNT